MSSLLNEPLPQDCLDARPRGADDFPRWKFKDADELLSSPMFDGKSIKDLLPEIKGWEPGF